MKLLELLYEEVARSSTSASMKAERPVFLNHYALARMLLQDAGTNGMVTMRKGVLEGLDMRRNPWRADMLRVRFTGPKLPLWLGTQTQLEMKGERRWFAASHDPLPRQRGARPSRAGLTVNLVFSEAMIARI